MATRRKESTPQGDALLDENLTPTGERRRIGRVERRVYKAIKAARDRGAIDDLEDPLAAAALAVAQSMDRASTVKVDPYAVVAASRELRELLLALSFATPRAGGGPASNPELDAFLASMAEPESTPA
jgi:hypothetical protein